MVPPALARSPFLGRIDDDLAFPFPRLPDDEREQVDGLIAELRSYCDGHYDARRVEAERWVPERYGGQRLSQTGYCTVFGAVGQFDSTLAVVLGVHQSIGCKGIHLFGTEEQKERFLPDLASGWSPAADALTEPNARARHQLPARRREALHRQRQPCRCAQGLRRQRRRGRPPHRRSRHRKRVLPAHPLIPRRPPQSPRTGRHVAT